MVLRVGVGNRLEVGLAGFAGRDVPPVDGDRLGRGRCGCGSRGRRRCAGRGDRRRVRRRASGTGAERKRRAGDERRESLTGSHWPGLLSCLDESPCSLGSAPDGGHSDRSRRVMAHPAREELWRGGMCDRRVTRTPFGLARPGLLSPESCVADFDSFGTLVPPVRPCQSRFLVPRRQRDRVETFATTCAVATLPG